MPSPAPPVPYQIDYPLFPPEIRNKIMEFALVPGDIHPPYSRNGVQLLATSRQNYEDGHVMYYSDNVFHIPRGRDPRRLLDKYQLKHLKLIRHVKLTCTILDIYEELFADPATAWDRKTQQSRLRHAINCLPATWIRKKLSIQSIFPNFEDLRVDFPDSKLVRAHQDLDLHDPLGTEIRTSLDEMHQRGFCSMVLKRHELGKHCDHWGKIDCYPDPPLPISRLNGRLAVFCFLVRHSFYAIEKIADDKCRRTNSLEGLRTWLAEKVEEEKRKYSR